jgi:hypothetical protein
MVCVHPGEHRDHEYERGGTSGRGGGDAGTSTSRSRWASNVNPASTTTSTKVTTSSASIGGDPSPRTRERSRPPRVAALVRWCRHNANGTVGVDWQGTDISSGASTGWVAPLARSAGRRRLPEQVIPHERFFARLASLGWSPRCRSRAPACGCRATVTRSCPRPARERSEVGGHWKDDFDDNTYSLSRRHRHGHSLSEESGSSPPTSRPVGCS